MEMDEENEEDFQQELTFLRKVQHLRVREYFLPALLELMTAPILPAANASMVRTSGSDEMHCIVTDSLRGWSSLSECIKFTRKSSVPTEQWTPMLWLWSLRVLMTLLTMQSERFALRRCVDLDMLLVSPNGCDLRLCSLAGGRFVRFGENGEDSDSLNHSLTKTLGCFIYDLLRHFFNADNLEVNTLALAGESDNEEDLLRKMRSQLIRVMSSHGSDENNLSAGLTDFSSVAQIVACGAGTREGGELENLCTLALLALQPASTRPDLASLWVYAGNLGSPRNPLS